MQKSNNQSEGTNRQISYLLIMIKIGQRSRKMLTTRQVNSG